MMKYRIYPLGTGSATIDFGNIISEKINRQVMKLAGLIEQNNFRGFIECVPAYSSLTVFYDVARVRRAFVEFPEAFAAVEFFLKNAVGRLEEFDAHPDNKTHEIPVSFAPEAALDLKFVAETNGLDTRTVIELFLAGIYRVYMLGFLPGFAYMGEVERQIATPRKKTPRTRVPRGSVGIAGRQTGIYPLASPGGWQIIGKTEVPLFTKEAERPTLFAPGDTVTFVKV